MNLHVLEDGRIWGLLFYMRVQWENYGPEDAEDLAGFLLVGFKERCWEAKLRV